jgi:regulator of sigma E protease
VKFAGDSNGASVPDPETLSQMSAAERAVSFHHKSVAKRAAIVAAGPIANFILAIAVFAVMIYANGRFVVAARANELVALTPDGTVRWSLARPERGRNMQ